jgi:hypothetical protein
MKDFLPAFTFNFLMAQLFPGSVAVLCMTCLYVVSSLGPAATIAFPSMMSLLSHVGDLWFGSTRGVVIFLFLSAATGMFLHGLAWMVLGWETQERDEDGKPVIGGSIPLRELVFHSQPLWRQMLKAPNQMIEEIEHLFGSPGLRWIVLEENVSEIEPSAMPNFTWLQDFYLHFGEFYLHMAYSLLMGFLPLLFTCAWLGLTTRRVIFLVFIYFLIGFFFLMGRTQLASLFMNEATLGRRANVPKKPLEVKVEHKRIL